MGLELDKPGFILALVPACEMSVWGCLSGGGELVNGVGSVMPQNIG